MKMVIATLYFKMCKCVLSIKIIQLYSQFLKTPQEESGDTIPSSLSSMLNLSGQTPLLIHMIQYKIRVRPRYFINRVWPTWTGQNVTWLTWMS